MNFVLNIDTLMHTWANWLFDGKRVKYVELYNRMPANSMSDHIRKIILVRSHRDRFKFVSNEKFPSRFMPNWFESLNPNGKNNRYGEGAFNTFGIIEWDVKNRKNNLVTFSKVFTKPLLYVSFASLLFLVLQRLYN